ncbi:MAG: PHP domain-containing protein [Anaerolineae bacterium]|nr:PHP domain-containing protein [Anaerolineae bacterium]
MIITGDNIISQPGKPNNEIVVNLHMHTAYSDGSGSHDQIADAAIETGLDAVIITDHNVLVTGKEGYREKNGRKVLVLIGQEIHDQARKPQKNHMLVFGAEKDLAPLASSTQQLINQVRAAGGLSFIAHPYDPALPTFNEDDISWVDWSVSGYTGIELWNAFSELKMVVHNKLEGLFFALFPQLIAHGPAQQVLAIWDDLLKQGRKIVAIGGSDAHALPMSLGPIHRTIFPYAFHFQTVNTHILLPQGLTGNIDTDKKMIYTALSNGHAFVGYDLPQSTRGFRFTAQTKEQHGVMGDTLSLDGGSVTFQISLPVPCECKLVHAGGDTIICKGNNQNFTHITSVPGAYRVECRVDYLGKQRGWIFSNPIYIS